MKKKRIELDVDFVGGEGKPTKEDLRVISEYIKTYRAKHLSGLSKKSRGRHEPAAHKSKLPV